MSRDERLGFRDEAYSRWHRSIPLELDFIDLDWMELCAACHRIVGMYELARYRGKEQKDAWATRQLAQRAQVPSFVVLYEVAPNGSIQAFHVRDLYPSESGAFKTLTPDEWVARLRKLRCHEVQPTPGRATPAPTRYAPFGTPIGTPRECSWCHQWHPVGTTCPAKSA